MSATAEVSARSWFTPIRMLEVEIGCPLPDITPACDRAGAAYTRAWALVRLHDQPLGIVELILPGGALTASALARAIWNALRAEINDHLRSDGLAAVAALDAAGVPVVERPACITERERAIAGAPPVSVVIATRDRPESLAACLQAFGTVTYPNYEIIVVDNAPATEATADLIASQYGRNPRIRYLRETHPGLGWAHNRGLRHARGEIIAFTDDDVIVDRHWLSELVRGFALGSHVGCVTGLVVPQEIETISQYWFDIHSGFNKGFRRRVFDLRAHRPEDRLFPYRASMFGTGANMAFRAGALRAIGGFDASLGPGTAAKNGEDLDVYFRVIEAGYQLVYQPSAFVHHVHRADYAALRGQFFTYGVGFSAFLTKCLVMNPWHFMRLLARIPAMLAFARSARARDRTATGPGYPIELTRAEWKGRLYGPVAYARSWWNKRRVIRRAGDVTEIREAACGGRSDGRAA